MMMARPEQDVSVDVVREWASDFSSLWECAGRCFRRCDTRGHAEGYIRALLGRMERKNGWQMAYCLCLAPANAALQELARTAGQRWNIECCFEAAKRETGLDEYEVRSWHGWYRHITLSMLALVFLSVARGEAASRKKRAKTLSRWRRLKYAVFSFSSFVWPQTTSTEEPCSGHIGEENIRLSQNDVIIRNE